MSTLPEHRRAIHGRTHDRAWCFADYDPITPYRGGNGPAWRLLRACVVYGFFAALGVALAVFLSR